MPFKKVGDNDYTSPSGRHYNSAQVRLYYANDGFPSHAGGGAVKGSGPKTASYAKGGPVIGSTSKFLKTPDRSIATRFMKTEDEFRDPGEINPNADEDQMYGKSGAGKGSGFIKPPKASTKSGK